MKRSTHLGKRLLALALVLCTITIVAFAAGYSRKVTTNIVVDGKLYSNTTNFEWDMEYVVPVGGIEWDGTEDFMEITYPDDGDIIESPDGTPYIKNQLTFFAVQGASIGSEFDSVQNLMASYGIRIIGYIAPTAEYQVETASDVSFEDLQALISQLNSEPLITSETVKLSWIYSIVPTQVYTASTVPGISDNPSQNSILWGGDPLEETVNGNNWGMEFIQAEKAWRYDPIMNPIRIGVVDAGFNDHVDISFSDLHLPNCNCPDPSMCIEHQDHGTHVTGIIAATHDSVGVSGVFHNAHIVATSTHDENYNDNDYASNPQEFIDTFPFANDYSFSYVIAKNNLDRLPTVVNYSMGFSKDKATSYENDEILETNSSKALNTSLSRLMNNGFDFVICTAAGNAYGSYDARYSSDVALIDNDSKLEERILIVGAIGLSSEGKPAHYRWGQSGECVDVAAPGVGIYSTVQTKAYQRLSGTSMASPHVAGVAAIIWSIDPSLTGSQVSKILLDSCNDQIAPRSDDRYRSADNNYLLLNASSATELACEQARKANINGTVYIETESDDSYLAIGASNALVTIYKDNREIDRTFTNSAGTFSFKNLEPGIYTITATKAGYEPSEKQSMIIKAGTDSTITINLKSSTTQPNVTEKVSGSVVGIDQEPISGVKITIENSLITAETDEAGLYSLQLTTGEYTFRFEKDGYIPAEVEVTVTVDDFETIVDAVVLDKETEKTGLVTGKVKSETGITLYDVNVQMWGSTYATHTDWDGNFTIELPAGFASLSFTKVGYADTRKSVTVVAEKTTDVGTITMAYDPTLPYVSLTTQTDGYLPQYTVTVHNPELKQVNKLDIKLVHSGIIYIDTANGISTDCQINGTSATFSWDEELIHGASLYVTISGPNWSQEYNCIMVAGSPGVEHMPMVD